MKPTGFVLICESFDFPFDYLMMAFSENREDLEKILPTDSPEELSDDCLINARTYRIEPISGLNLPERRKISFGDSL